MSAAVATIGQSARVRRRLTSHAPKNERISGQLQVARRSRNTSGRRMGVPLGELRPIRPDACAAPCVTRSRADVCVALARVALEAGLALAEPELDVAGGAVAVLGQLD